MHEIIEQTEAVRAHADSTVVRVRVSGKFLFAGNEKLYVKGVTYGSFPPDAEGFFFPGREQVEQDFAGMARAGFNCVRVYTPPPVWLLDVASQYGLYVMVGIGWEQHIAFLDEPGRADKIERFVRESVRPYAGHPAVLCLAVGNEIPPPIVRWHGARKIERFIRRLYEAVKAEDPECLVTYVNFPTTEYLDLSFLDLVCFNVYLETRERLEAYLARLQNLAGEQPLILAEMGLDSRRNGEAKQASKLVWQIEAAFAAGSAGTFVFGWTDEWYCGAFEINDWDFGLVRRDRSHKPALNAVARAYENVPFAKDVRWPRVTVVVCTYNGRRTIRDCFEALQRLDYPNFEVLVVSDGSSDGCVALAYGYRLRVIAGSNRGLSEARNTGFRAGTGEIIAYIDDDAYPDPQWLRYLAHAFLSTDHAAIGGPNLAPGGTGWIADCVARAPGGPNHVLISDLEAEHIPGCNMAYRKRALEAVDGFDGQFRIAGDDVDLCWKLLERGWTIGFSPAAMVWHHRRNSVKAYWRQQKNYGKAEAMLERKWPEKFNSAGHATWAGRVYGKGHTAGMQIWRSRIYQGIWGSAPFQSLYEPPATILEYLPLMPEWYLVNGALALVVILGLLWHPLLAVAPLLALTAGLPLLQAIVSAVRSDFPTNPLSTGELWKRRGLTAVLHVLQPLARLWGRLSFGLSPWRMRFGSGLAWPDPRRLALWSEAWKPVEDRMQSLFEAAKARATYVDAGGEYDRWDLRVRAGLLGSARLLMAVEHHTGGHQLIRFEVRPHAPAGILLLATAIAGLAATAWASGAWIAGLALAVTSALLFGRVLLEESAAVASTLAAVKQLAAEQDLLPMTKKRTRGEQ